MRKSQILTIRLPENEFAELAARAKAAGLSRNAYAAGLLSRERVDSAAAVAILTQKVAADNSQIIAAINAVEQKNAAAIQNLAERFDRLRDAILQIAAANKKQ